MAVANSDQKIKEAPGLTQTSRVVTCHLGKNLMTLVSMIAVFEEKAPPDLDRAGSRYSICD